MKAVILASTILATLTCQAAASYLGTEDDIITAAYSEIFGPLFLWDIVPSEYSDGSFTIQNVGSKQYTNAPELGQDCQLSEYATPFQNETVLKEGQTYYTIQININDRFFPESWALEVDDHLMTQERDESNDRQLLIFEEVEA
ncbi:uncharacterized protein BO87DRAFT_384776 [Aspergillus neoniger CBS 115656]|uniref:Uncharacterized protein n=1 Tax=Aspergillus neoniger (strain CBS 115656) TaxID=1448310 RepID=A0A318YWT2_ASPNB|nr:hypothetical protein BO87DRAFT_384776 [Aspergillus neoniger CBS 115656]PYH36320.1 hypothetical protein BO87DRAFT_384776 [Aspergillus neoniger CBS 115656]